MASPSGAFVRLRAGKPVDFSAICACHTTHRSPRTTPCQLLHNNPPSRESTSAAECARLPAFTFFLVRIPFRPSPSSWCGSLRIPPRPLADPLPFRRESLRISFQQVKRSVSVFLMEILRSVCGYIDPQKRILLSRRSSILIDMFSETSRHREWEDRYA